VCGKGREATWDLGLEFLEGDWRKGTTGNEILDRVWRTKGLLALARLPRCTRCRATPDLREQQDSRNPSTGATLVGVQRRGGMFPVGHGLLCRSAHSASRCTEALKQSRCRLPLEILDCIVHAGGGRARRLAHLEQMRTACKADKIQAHQMSPWIPAPYCFISKPTRVPEHTRVHTHLAKTANFDLGRKRPVVENRVVSPDFFPYCSVNLWMLDEEDPLARVKELQCRATATQRGEVARSRLD